MLKKIIINNINSIDKCELDFKKGNYQYLQDNTIDDIANPIALYGHNGSGKTSIFNAIASLINFMVEPVEFLTPFVVNNFLFEEYKKNKDESKIIGSIELLFSLDDVNFDYYIETSRLGYISKEFLKKNDEIIIQRDRQSYSYNNKPFSFDNMSFLVPAIRKLASSEINDEIIQKCYSFISSFTFVNLPFINRGAFVTSKMYKNMSINELLVNYSEEVKEILKNYNEFPIYSIKKKNSLNSNNNPNTGFSLVIEGENFKGELPFEMISAGMRSQSVLLSIILSMPKNGVLFVDELEQALHPSAIVSFLRVIKEKKIQLVFSSHNTYILQLLRPDQVYFAKWHNGFSKYARLSKIYPNIREINNMEKMYLSSVFDESIKNAK
ncbi:MAG: AAA family ATPase [bacterium]|nr:AAA family ATPase [bacterium]